MKIVISCAGSKHENAGSMQTLEGKPVRFVADPQNENVSNPKDYKYAKPDDPADSGETWRDRLLAYNKSYEKTGSNPYRLWPAYQLYTPEIYKDLVKKYGIKNIYIMSAGWGLVPASFLTPKYNITYSFQSARGENKYILRRKNDSYKDFCMLPNGETDRVVFFGGNNYLNPFCKLTEDYAGTRFCYYNSGKVPSADGVTLVRYPTTTRTNWQYECAQKFMDGYIFLSHTNA